jgi:hypothetical protein
MALNNPSKLPNSINLLVRFTILSEENHET